MKNLSVFFPCYNEEKNIESLTRKFLSLLPAIADQFEIIIVNDGSRDRTRQVAEALARTDNRVRVVHQSNKGYGGALKTGFRESKSDWVFFTDGDGQFNPDELRTFLPFQNQFDFIIGYRVKRVEGAKRALFQKLLSIWARIFFGFPAGIKDIDCAFKLIRRSALEKCLPLESDGAMISTELLLKAFLSGARVQQVGVQHYPRLNGNPTGQKINVILKAVRETFLLRKTIGAWRTKRSTA